MNILDDLRKEVQLIDDQIANLLSGRFVVTNCIGALKKRRGLPIENLELEDKKIALMAPELQLIFKEIFKVSKQCQNTIE